MTRLASRPELRPARTHAPEALAALESAHAVACDAIDPALADALRRRVAASLGVPVETPPSAEPEQACVAFADQFVVAVPGVTQEQRDAVAGRVGPERVLELARMLYVFDMSERLVLSLGCLFPPEGDRPDESPGPVARQPLGSAVEGLHAAAMRLHALDPVTTELVRLHCARYHDCKT
jgi:alkylhydroperoxidase family enzyme